MSSQEHETSLEHIQTSELYPKKLLTSDDDQLQVPFPELCGESVEFLSRTEDGIIALSNFRLFISQQTSFVNVPVRLIEAVDSSQMFYVHFYCKDARTFRCKFLTNELCAEWVTRVTRAIQPPTKLQELFAFYFRAWSRDMGLDSLELPTSVQGTAGYRPSFDAEVMRMGFDLKSAWRISYLNDKYEACDTYPKLHIIPKSVSDEDLQRAANFRTSHRFPSVVWRDQRSGAVIARCSQPEVGWFSWRCQEDENILQAIAQACSINSRLSPTRSNGAVANGDVPVDEDGRKMLVVDARSYTAALANRTKGGGVECPEYYPTCEIQFMNLANIHSIRKSFQAVRALCATSPEQQSWLSGLEATRWLQHISNLMRAAQTVVTAVDKERRPVLVHCSDGWDRTPQITALAQIMLDPHYRTIEGFQTLVEREWLEFGHKFGDRCGHGVQSEDLNERCPVFLQWLDCVYQLMKQYPCAFQFGETFLVKLAQHTYSCVFGTFLCNNSCERSREKVAEQTFSVWSLFKRDSRFINFLYSDNTYHVLKPSFQLKRIEFWSALYLSDSIQTEECTTVAQCDETSSEGSVEQQPLVKTRSCDDIKAAVDHAGNPRRLSDPNIPSELSDMLKSSLQEGLTQDTDKHLEFCSEGVKYTCKPSEGDVTKGDQSETTAECADGTQAQDAQVAVDSEQSDPGKSDELDMHEMQGEVCELTTDSSAVLTNGHSSDKDDQSCDIPGVHKTCVAKSGEAVADTESTSTEKSVESSTDTLYGDLSAHSNPARTSLARPSSGHLELTGGALTGIRTSESISGSSDTLADSSLTLDKYASISTSTSDISDSHIHVSGDRLVLPHRALHLDSTVLSLPIPDLPSAGVLRVNGHPEPLVVNGYYARGCSRDSVETSSCDTPYNSRTPSSTNPPTPAADIRMSNPWVHRSLHRHLDVDGLTAHRDPVQAKMRHLVGYYEAKIEELNKQLHRLALYHYASGHNGTGRFALDTKEDNTSNPESTGSGELHSLGAGSNAPSDVSWEQVEGEDARMTLWVPDHVVTHCGGCNQPFGWIVNRKHHCRNCGQVFCGECANKFTPVPAQQLATPVRVCTSCYGKLQGHKEPPLVNGHTSHEMESCKAAPRIIAPAN